MRMRLWARECLAQTCERAEKTCVKRHCAMPAIQGNWKSIGLHPLIPALSDTAIKRFQDRQQASLWGTKIITDCSSQFDTSQQENKQGLFSAKIDKETPWQGTKFTHHVLDCVFAEQTKSRTSFIHFANTCLWQFSSKLWVDPVFCRGNRPFCDVILISLLIVSPHKNWIYVPTNHLELIISKITQKTLLLKKKVVVTFALPDYFSQCLLLCRIHKPEDDNFQQVFISKVVLDEQL